MVTCADIFSAVFTAANTEYTLMQSKEKITRENAMDIIRRFAKEYRKTQEQFRKLCAKSVEELKNLYDSQKDTESFIGNQLITYIEDGVKINTKNMRDVAARIREKMNQNQ